MKAEDELGEKAFECGRKAGKRFRWIVEGKRCLEGKIRWEEGVTWWVFGDKMSILL